VALESFDACGTDASTIRIAHSLRERPAVGKDPESPYAGGRSLKWIKVRQPKYREGERGFEKPADAS
jgi:hypothetical protein